MGTGARIRPVVVVLLAATAVAPTAPWVGSATATSTRWIRHADVDGDGVRDRIVVTLGRDFEMYDAHDGSGHYRVRVTLSRTGNRVVKRLVADHYADFRDDEWTPWFGATQVDHRTGKELLLGYTSGAHATVFHMLTLRQGALDVVMPPKERIQGGWMVNSSVGTGSQGWRCTDHGIRRRKLYPTSDGNGIRVERSSYVWRGGWDRVAHFTRTYYGQPPSWTANYASFDCKGLPAQW